MDEKNVISAVINTLERITVSGRKNLDGLLASIMSLEKVVKSLTEKEKAAKPQEVKQSDEDDLK